jgi:hypothetical protein
MLDLNLPHDRRNFVHRRIIGGVTGFVTGGPLAAVSGFARPSPSAAPTADSSGACPPGMRNTRGRAPGGPCVPAMPAVAAASFAPPTACLPLQRKNPITGACEWFVGEQPGREPGGVGGGEVVMGQYGAAETPDVTAVTTLNCRPGMILGKDNLCYNKRDLTNTERKWARGRRPLLTGGDRNAITRAARAAKAIQRTEKQLQKMGMLKSPTRRKAPAPRARQIGPGGPSIINVE